MLNQKSSWITFGAGLLMAVLILGGCRWTRGTDSPGPAPGEPRRITVETEHRSCTTAADCTMMQDDCSSCSCGTAVNKAYLDDYRARLDEHCRTYSGPVCDFYCPIEKLVCRSGQCDFVPREE